MMFSKLESDPSQLECTVPLGVGQNHKLSVQISGCRNPLCDCQEIQVELLSDSLPFDEKMVLNVDFTKREVSAERIGNNDLCPIIIHGMDSGDWELLERQYFIFKASNTVHADLDKLEPVFPIYDVEKNSILIGYEEVLPFHPIISFSVGDIRYFARDLYCVNRHCHCNQVHLSICPDDESWDMDRDGLLAALNLKTGKYNVEEQNGLARGVKTREVVQSILQAIPIEELNKRYQRMRRWYQSHFDRIQVQGRLIDVVRGKPALSLVPEDVSVPSVGRNDPCPCGSGKKYKKCCLN